MGTNREAAVAQLTVWFDAGLILSLNTKVCSFEDKEQVWFRSVTNVSPVHTPHPILAFRESVTSLSSQFVSEELSLTEMKKELQVAFDLLDSFLFTTPSDPSAGMFRNTLKSLISRKHHYSAHSHSRAASCRSRCESGNEERKRDSKKSTLHTGI